MRSQTYVQTDWLMHGQTRLLSCCFPSYAQGHAGTRRDAQERAGTRRDAQGRAGTYGQTNQAKTTLNESVRQDKWLPFCAFPSFSSLYCILINCLLFFWHLPIVIWCDLSTLFVSFLRANQKLHNLLCQSACPSIWPLSVLINQILTKSWYGSKTRLICVSLVSVWPGSGV